MQALEWEDQYSSATPPPNEHPMPLPRAGSKGNLAEMGGRRNSTGDLAGNGVPEMGEWEPCRQQQLQHADADRVAVQ
jgi:hypothetical protein